MMPGLLDDTLRARRVALNRVPVIDLAPLHGAGDRQAMARDIHAALANIGFMYVRNHGVDQALVDAAFAQAETFFALPEATKMALHIRDSGPALHGYTELCGEATDPGRSRDLKEIFDLGRMAEDGRVRPFFGPTPWPPGRPAFRDTMMGYHHALLDLAKRLMGAIALSLDLPEDWFAPMMQEPIAIQRLLHYPPQDSVADDSLIGIGAHTDYGCLTLLAQDPVGGLQVMNRDGAWIEAPHVPGTFVVNIGDMIQRLTNDVYIANIHRVINVSGQERYSIPFFFDLDADTVIAPLKGCTGPGNPAKYAPVECGAHKWARYKAAYAHLK